jgi:erythromycin esterase
MRSPDDWARQSNARTQRHGAAPAAKWRRRTGVRSIRVVPLALLIASITPGAQSDPGREAFLAWTADALLPLTTVRADAPHDDLRGIAGMIGAADIVALSEADHGVAEPLEFRNRLFRYLAEEHGFTAIAIESGVTESRVVHDYVLGGPGELKDVLAQGIGWTFDRMPQNADLIRWMREYNANPRNRRKLSFYGFDVPGSPGNAEAKRGMRTALDDALNYLESVDSAEAAGLHTRLDRWLPHLRVDRRPVPGPRYRDLSGPDRDALTAAVADLVTLFEHRQARYSQVSSPTDYEWAYRSALGARAADAWLRKTVLTDPGRLVFREAMEVRDRMQAENVRWIVDQQRGGKVMLFGAWVHMATASLPYWGADRTDTAVAGTYLRRHYGDRLLSIGNLFRRGKWYCGPDAVSRDEAVAGSLSNLLGPLNEPLFLLDLRSAPPAARSWLDHDRVVSDTYPWGRYELNVARAFDLLLYMDRVTPACPADR